MNNTKNIDFTKLKDVDMDSKLTKETIENLSEKQLHDLSKMIKLKSNDQFYSNMIIPILVNEMSKINVKTLPKCSFDLKKEKVTLKRKKKNNDKCIDENFDSLVIYNPYLEDGDKNLITSIKIEDILEYLKNNENNKKLNKKKRKI